MICLQFQPGLSCTGHIQPVVCRGSLQPPSVSQAIPEPTGTSSESFLPSYFKPGVKYLQVKLRSTETPGSAG